MWNNLILAALTGLASALFLNWPPWWWLGLVSFVPLFWLLNQAKSRLNAFGLGFAFGLGLMGANLIWFFQTLPLSWMGIESSWLAGPAVALAWLLFVIAAAIFISLFALAWRELRRGDWRDWVLAPALWIIFEYLRAWAITILFAGPGTIIGPHWTNGLAGYLLVESPQLSILAASGGIYLLSFVVISINYLVYQLVISPAKQRQYLAIPVLILLVWLIFWPTELITPINESNSSLRLAVANTYSSSASKLDALDQQLAGKTFDILALPEDSRLIAHLATSSPEFVFSNLNQLTGKSNNGQDILLIDSIRSGDGGQIKSKILYLNTKTEEINYTEKRLLATYGEYLPYFARGLARLAGLDNWLINYNQERSVIAGPAFAPVPWRGEHISVLACSEIFSPALHLSQTRAGATILGNASSQSLFHGSRWFYQQSLATARVRAAESNRALFQATDDAPSFIISPTGQVIAESKWQKPSVLFATITTSTTLTLYTRLGDWPVILALLFLIFLSVATDGGTRRQNRRGK